MHRCSTEEEEEEEQRAGGRKGERIEEEGTKRARRWQPRDHG